MGPFRRGQGCRCRSWPIIIAVLCIYVEVIRAQDCGTGIGDCPNHECCSQYGYCGTTSAYCGVGCQNGPCGVSTPGPAAQPGGVCSVNVPCAGGINCCSAYNFCGNTSQYCGVGCQAGPCYALVPPATPPAGASCGNTTVGGPCSAASRNALDWAVYPTLFLGLVAAISQWYSI